MEKRVISLLMALVMVFTMVTPISASAASITEVQVEQKMKAAESIWKDGSRYVDKLDDGCSTCFGFVRELFSYVYGASLPTAWGVSNAKFSNKNIEEVGHLNSGYSLSELQNLLKKAKPGDVLLASNGKYNHAVMIRSVASGGTGIYVFDANWLKDKEGRPLIRTNSLWTASTMQKTRTVGVTLYRYADYVICPHSKGYKTIEKSDGTYAAICKSCKEEYEIGKLNTSAKGIYKATKTLSLCTAPYQDSGDRCVKKGTKVTIVGSVKNAYGNTWYKTSDGMWVYPSYVKKTGAISSTLSISNETCPTGTVKKGSGFSLQGTIKSNYKITKIEAYICDPFGKVVKGFGYSRTWNKTSYDIKKNGIDSKFRFGSLAKGTYVYVVEATDASGLTVTLINSTFTVK